MPDRVPDPGMRDQTLRLGFPADPPSVRAALAQMAQSPPLSDLAAEFRAGAELVLAEVLNNIAEHAYAGRPGTVTVTLQSSPLGLNCLIEDFGLPMPDGRLPEGRLPDLADQMLADLPEGGFGWHLIRSLTQDLTYARLGDRNRVTFLLPR